MYAFKNSITLCTLSSICLLFSPNYQVVALCLFLLGIGMAGEIAVGGTVFFEFCPPSKRFYLTLMSLFLCVGSTSIALIGFGITYLNTTSIKDWRIIIGFGVLFEIIALFFRFFMLETPVYSYSKGDFSKAERILNIISLKNNGKEFLFTDAGMSKSGIYELEDSSINCANTESLLKKSKNSALKKFCKGKTIKTSFFLSTVFLIQTYFFATFAYTGFIDFMPELLSDFSKSESYGIIAFQMLCGFPGVILGTYLVETRLGRKMTGVIFFIVGGLSCLPLDLDKNKIAVRKI